MMLMMRMEARWKLPILARLLAFLARLVTSVVALTLSSFQNCFIRQSSDKIYLEGQRFELRFKVEMVDKIPSHYLEQMKNHCINFIHIIKTQPNRIVYTTTTHIKRHARATNTSVLTEAVEAVWLSPPPASKMSVQHTLSIPKRSIPGLLQKTGETCWMKSNPSPQVKFSPGTLASRFTPLPPHNSHGFGGVRPSQPQMDGEKSSVKLDRVSVQDSPGNRSALSDSSSCAQVRWSSRPSLTPNTKGW